MTTITPNSSDRKNIDGKTNQSSMDSELCFSFEGSNSGSFKNLSADLSYDTTDGDACVPLSHDNIMLNRYLSDEVVKVEEDSQPSQELDVTTSNVTEEIFHIIHKEQRINHTSKPSGKFDPAAIACFGEIYARANWTSKLLKKKKWCPVFWAKDDSTFYFFRSELAYDQFVYSSLSSSNKFWRSNAVISKIDFEGYHFEMLDVKKTEASSEKYPSHSFKLLRYKSKGDTKILEKWYFGATSLDTVMKFQSIIHEILHRYSDKKTS